MVQGRGVNASLNETGRQQARKTFEYLKDIPFDSIYTSELIRTRETVSGFEEAGYQLHALSGFDEISWGSMEGVKATTEEKNLYAQTVKEWQSGNLEANVGGGESPIEVMNRQKIAMQKVLSSSDQTILICMHGRAIRILLSWLLNYPLQFMDGFPHKNCCYYKLKNTGSQFVIEEFNVTSHLNG